ncbi:unnamed protein product, partial [Amoebophrya sp. A25]
MQKLSFLPSGISTTRQGQRRGDDLHDELLATTAETGQEDEDHEVQVQRGGFEVTALAHRPPDDQAAS